MKYIVYRRFRSNAMCGAVNLRYGTELESHDNLILYDGNPVCYTTSQNAHDFFSRNDDGKGLDRGELTQCIIKTLSKRDKSYQDRWDKVWADELCRQYKRKEHDDFWFWNHAFYNADIIDLQYIANLINL